MRETKFEMAFLLLTVQARNEVNPLQESG